MRLLHTGDWHVGRSIRGRSREDEFSGALDEVVGIATDEKVDVVLIAGDIYDQRAVTPDADRLVFDVLLRLNSAGIPVVAVPGNHDSAARLEALAPLLERIGVSLVCRMRPPDQGGAVTVPAREGSHAARISCLPFVSPRHFSSATQLFEDVSAGYVEFDRGMGDLVSAYSRAFDETAINVVLGHMFVSGAQPGGGEREITIGADFAVSPARLPATANYVALGHIHKPQAVRGAPGPARYCGSLIQLDFGERDQDKSVVVVDAAPGRRAQTRAIPITSGRRLTDVAGTLDELEALAPKVGDAYLRATVKVDHPVPGIADRVRELLPNVLDVRLEYERSEAEERPTLRGLEPSEQFVAYYRSHHATDPAEELLAAFNRVYEEVRP
ncbi:MAG TPA: exonuclease SbcCD subunit D [Actinomycetota bacterium]|jgi:exonuclease SbcD|nr:exonuclease SbcCD subunit D [Actinomycetota bacterium]